MPVEIRELVIRTQIENGPRASDGTDPNQAAQLEALKKEMIQEVLQRTKQLSNNARPPQYR